MMKLRSLALLSLLALPACGFTPIYGNHGDNAVPVAQALNNIVIENIADRDGQILRNDLIDRMYGKNRPEQPAYHLTVKTSFNEESLGILANSTATRSLLNMQAEYVLNDAQGYEVLKGTAHSVASFDLLDQIYGSVAARDSAHERTLHEISEQIVNRLSLHFSEDK